MKKKKKKKDEVRKITPTRNLNLVNIYLLQGDTSLTLKRRSMYLFNNLQPRQHTGFKKLSRINLLKSCKILLTKPGMNYQHLIQRY